MGGREGVELMVGGREKPRRLGRMCWAALGEHSCAVRCVYVLCAGQRVRMAGCTLYNGGGRRGRGGCERRQYGGGGGGGRAGAGARRRACKGRGDARAINEGWCVSLRRARTSASRKAGFAESSSASPGATPASRQPQGSFTAATSSAELQIWNRQQAGLLDGRREGGSQCAGPCTRRREAQKIIIKNAAVHVRPRGTHAALGWSTPHRAACNATHHPPRSCSAAG